MGLCPKDAAKRNERNNGFFQLQMRESQSYPNINIYIYIYGYIRIYIYLFLYILYSQPPLHENAVIEMPLFESHVHVFLFSCGLVSPLHIAVDLPLLRHKGRYVRIYFTNMF